MARPVAPASIGQAPKSESPLPGAASFSWYRVELTNRSIAEEVRREAVRAHLIWLASKLDDDTLHHQLISLRYELMAASQDEFAAELRRRAEAIQANKIETEEDA